MHESDQAMDDAAPSRAERADRHEQFLALFLASEREIFRYISVLVPAVNDAQDVLQQTALALWRKYDAYDISQPFTPWACRFALLEVKEFLRRRRKWQALLEGGLADELIKRRETMAADLSQRFDHLAECLNKLPAAQRSILEGYYYRQQTVEALSEAVGRTVEAVYKSLQRIRAALLDCVTEAARRDEAMS